MWTILHPPTVSFSSPPESSRGPGEGWVPTGSYGPLGAPSDPYPSVSRGGWGLWTVVPTVFVGCELGGYNPVSFVLTSHFGPSRGQGVGA